MIIRNPTSPALQLDAASKLQKLKGLKPQEASKKEDSGVKGNSDQKSNKVWKRPVLSESVRDPVGYAENLANEELLKALAPFKKDSRRGNVELRLLPDSRNSPKGRFGARILDHEGYSLAEVWGTKQGKARTYRLNPGREIDPSEENQVSIALPIARRYVTGKPEAAHADDSAPESGSDTSDDDV